MPIIQKVTDETESTKSLKLKKKIFDEVKDYCKHFEVSLDEFANQAFQFVLRKDKDWKSTKKSKKTKV